MSSPPDFNAHGLQKERALRGTHSRFLHTVWRLIAGAIALLSLFAAAEADNSQTPAPFPVLEIRTAELTSLSGARQVQLPNVLQDDDYNPAGDRVKYRLLVALPRAPHGHLGIFIPKMSVSGSVYLNGKWIADCEHGPIERARCLHRPYLFTPADALWKEGENVIDVEVYVNPRQMNGLSPVFVGDAAVLHDNYFATKHFLQVELTRGLTWACLIIGLVLVSVSFWLRDQPMYFWFGVASLAGAIANVNVIAVRVIWTPEFYGWLVFAGRLITVPLFYVAILSAFGFERTPRAILRSLIAFIFIGPAIVALTASNRHILATLYIPWILALPVLLYFAAKWSWATKRALHVAVAIMTGVAILAAVRDWMRLAGHSQFEGVYMLSFASSGILLIAGALLVGALAQAMNSARALQRELAEKVAERTKELAEANRQLLDLSRTDSLTGLANRRHFDEALQQEWNVARRAAEPLSLMVLDIDHFKAFNDLYGHLEGDHCLKRVAAIIKANVRRPRDLAARYGGEEFVILAAGADATGAAHIAEAIRAQIEASAIAHGQAPEKIVTVTLGVATVFPTGDFALEHLFKEADAALYRAKRAGRNRIAVAVDVEAAPAVAAS